MEDWQIRLQHEYDALTLNHIKLEKFINSEDFEKLEEADQCLLETQWCAMTAYGNVLEVRLNRISTKEETKDA